jgi:hypothetical protein
MAARWSSGVPKGTKDAAEDLSSLASYLKSMGVTDYATPTKGERSGTRPKERGVLGERSSNVRVETPDKEAMKQQQANIRRFWEQEMVRKGQPRENPARRKNRNGAPANFVPPKRPEEAKAMWENMKKDLDKRLSKAGDEVAASKPMQSARAQAAGDEVTASKPMQSARAPAAGMGRRAQPEVKRKEKVVVEEDCFEALPPPRRRSTVYSNDVRPSHIITQAQG